MTFEVTYKITSAVSKTVTIEAKDRIAAINEARKYPACKEVIGVQPIESTKMRIYFNI